MPRSLAALLLAVLLAACRTSSPAPAPSSHGTGGVNRVDQQGKPYVVLVSIDGFRHDYLDRYAAPHLQRVAARGVRAAGLVPTFPSKTFPNHYSIVTGLHAGEHGLVANSFYDPARAAAYTMSNRAAVRDPSWYRGEPIWTTAERHGLVTAPYFWVGSEAPIGGAAPAIWHAYDGTVPNEARVDSVLTWLRRPPARRPHLVTLYMSAVDDAGHRHGPEAPEVGAAVADVDRVIGRLVDGLDALPHGRAVTLVVVSDHGMAAYTPDQAYVLEDLVDTTGVRVADAGPNANLHVRGGPERARAVRDALNRGLGAHGRAYLRAETPERFHYRADPRVGDVVVVMEVPYQITLRARRPTRAGGTHGWDPAAPAMRGLFLAMGPGLKAGVTIPAFENVEIYPFLAETLGLRPAPGLSGRTGWLRAQLRR